MIRPPTGCLCGCLTEDECRYVDRTPLPTVVVVHHVHHYPIESAQHPVVQGEVIDSEERQ